MAHATLMADRGSCFVTPEELRIVPCPEPTKTYYPVPHSQVLDLTKDVLRETGFEFRREQLALSRNNQQFFGTLELAVAVSVGVNLCVGIRNSTDRTLPLGLIAGTRVFVCSNLCFRADLINVRHKHTLNGFTRFREAIGAAVRILPQFRRAEGERIRRLQYWEISEETAAHYLLQAFDRQIISHTQLRSTYTLWKEPQHEEFVPRTMWSLLNAFTGALSRCARSNPIRFERATIKLQQLLDGNGEEGAPA